MQDITKILSQSVQIGKFKRTIPIAFCEGAFGPNLYNCDTYFIFIQFKKDIIRFLQFLWF